jgi:hypothetical protein
MRVAMLRPTSPNSRRKTLPESRIMNVRMETPIVTPTSPHNSVALPFYQASLAYRIELAMTPGPTGNGITK